MSQRRNAVSSGAGRPNKIASAPKRSRKDRLLGELKIDGTEKLCGTQMQRQTRGGAYKARGGSWVDVEAESNESPSPRRRAGSHPSTAAMAPATKKRKRSAHDEPLNDQSFLDQVRDQFREFKKPLRHDLRAVMRYLEQIESPPEARIARKWNGDEDADQEIDAYYLTSTDARSLLRSSKTISAPVFVSNSINTVGILDPDSDKRPVEQILDWLTDSTEDYDLHEAGKVQYSTTEQLRDTFTAHNGFVGEDRQPQTFLDIANPFHHSGMPVFVQSPQCNLLRDTMRYLLDVSPVNICQRSCKRREANSGRCCAKHFLTTEEFTEVQQGWRAWQGAVLLSEAGAVTAPHFDKWGFGTWISCWEGEIGFGWLTAPEKTHLQAIVAGEDYIEGRWMFKVLRPGDSLYLSPGTPHLVFRLPRGRQTAALAGHAVRRCDITRWVELLALDVKEGQRQNDDSSADLVRALATGIEYMLDVAVKDGKEVIYGGEQVLRKAQKAVQKLTQ
ncbi:hypothetical protein KC340_g12669 [Hortaea werneckii]|nr:hypothetical protein KC342_g12896 [Hortaea werneckii]KAI7073881.1 hypothetical protein KC339_g14151 [Hortaea werneckii]KAI7225236.1 hypothetical protein KC365_g10106 [Hortaea werneckii]KAI7302708.1 hypothetical protein KC340_g12669 [Hortaea werneckii]KAI7383507.1 hypothetical protein KC328_g11247 [Hortaea werneckii]